MQSKTRMSIQVTSDESTASSKTYESAISDFVRKFEGNSGSFHSQSRQAPAPAPPPISDKFEPLIVTDEKADSLCISESVDEKSMTTESLDLHMAIDANPKLVKNMLQTSSWYNAFVSAEQKEIPRDDASCTDSKFDSSTVGGSSDPLADFTDYQLFQLQQYRIAELTSQLDLVKNSVSEYHDLLDKFQRMQQENRILTHKVTLLEDKLGEKMSTAEKQKIKLEKK